MRINTAQKGLSLVEVLVYIAGMVMVLGAITLSIAETYRVYNILAHEARIDRIGVTIVDSLTKEVRSGVSVDQSETVFDDAEGVLTFNALVDETSVTKYFGLENGRVVFRENGGSAVYLTPEDVVVSRLLFTEVSNDVSYGVRYEVALTYTVKGQLKTETYTGFAILRHSYE